MSAPVLPASLIDNPRLDRWIRFLPDRTVRTLADCLPVPDEQTARRLIGMLHLAAGEAVARA